MKKFVMAALGGTVAGALITTQVAGPLIAQETDRSSSVYEQLDLFGDIFGDVFGDIFGGGGRRGDDRDRDGPESGDRWRRLWRACGAALSDSLID